MEPLVSILIPCYNAGPWIADTLESALAQSWPNKEIIVVDDGSRDDSLVVARRFESRGVRVVSQQNSGASAARNHALRLARGDFFQFLDADDLLTSEKIAVQVAQLAELGADCVAMSRWGRFVDDPANVRFSDDEVCRDYLPIDYLLDHTGAARMVHPAAWLVPRALADAAGVWDETLSLNDDGEYFARVVLAARKIISARSVASLYRSSLSQSLSRRRDRRALESLVRSIELIAAHVQCAEPDLPRVRAALANYWQRLVFELYPGPVDLRLRAEGEVRRLGGSTLKPDAGPWRRRLQACIGWKATKRLHALLYGG